MEGTLMMNIIDANLSRDTESVGQMDPIVRLKYMNGQYRTKEQRDGGKHPIWNQNICVRINTNNSD